VAAEARLPLIDLVVPSLRRLSAGQFQHFHRTVGALAGADHKLDLFEFTLIHILLRHVAPSFSAAPPRRVRYYSLSGISSQCSVLLSVLARNGSSDAGETAQAFKDAAARLDPVTDTLALLPSERCGLKDLDLALRELACAAPMLRKKLVEAAAVCVAHDRKVTLEEGELLRAVSDSLDCPSPPYIPGQEI
jgi:hypothetical protein